MALAKGGVSLHINMHTGVLMKTSAFRGGDKGCTVHLPDCDRDPM